MFTLIRFDIVTMTSPGFLRDFSVIYEVKSYRDVAMTWMSTNFLHTRISGPYGPLEILAPAGGFLAFLTCVLCITQRDVTGTFITSLDCSWGALKLSYKLCYHFGCTSKDITKEGTWNGHELPFLFAHPLSYCRWNHEGWLPYIISLHRQLTPVDVLLRFSFKKITLTINFFYILNQSK